MLIVFASSFCFAASPANEQSSQGEPTDTVKAATLRQEAQNWIMVGNSQMKKGLYQDAEKSFLVASEYQDYLPADEKNKLQENLDKAHKGGVERQAVMEHLKLAKNFSIRASPSRPALNSRRFAAALMSPSRKKKKLPLI